MKQKYETLELEREKAKIPILPPARKPKKRKKKRELSRDHIHLAELNNPLFRNASVDLTKKRNNSTKDSLVPSNYIADQAKFKYEKPDLTSSSQIYKNAHTRNGSRLVSALGGLDSIRLSNQTQHRIPLKLPQIGSGSIAQNDFSSVPKLKASLSN